MSLQVKPAVLAIVKIPSLGEAVIVLLCAALLSGLVMVMVGGKASINFQLTVLPPSTLVPSVAWTCFPPEASDHDTLAYDTETAVFELFTSRYQGPVVSDRVKERSEDVTPVKFKSPLAAIA